MNAVTFAEARPAAGTPFTVADLDQMPDDDRRHELFDGALVVSPRPVIAHQWVATRLASVLLMVCPDDLGVVAEPVLQITQETELAPDIVVVHVDQAIGAKLTTPPLLVVEVRSPSTAVIDLSRTNTVYETFGVPSYWVVDPRASQARADRLRVAGWSLRPGGEDDADRHAGAAVPGDYHPG